MDLNIAEIVLDEIALEGLDGITISTLWLRLATRETPIPFSLDDSFKNYIWNNLILKHKELEFFCLPSPRPLFVPFDRFEIVDADTGVCIEQNRGEDCYPVSIVLDKVSSLKGSCSCFETRKNITTQFKDDRVNLDSAVNKYGEKLVIVASQRLRSISLFGKNICELGVDQLVNDDKIYCFLERVGRSRQNGELTFGSYNINNAFNIKAANTFPLRKKLMRYKLITVQDFSLKQIVPSSNQVGKLMLLSRFHKDHVPVFVTHLTSICSIVGSSPHGKLLVSKIKEQLNFTDEVFRKLLKLGSKYLKIESRPYREFSPDAKPHEYLNKGKNAERVQKVLKLVMPYKGFSAEEEDRKVQDDDDDVDIICTDANGYGMFPEETTFVPHIDQTSLAECYKIIDAYGSVGLRMAELGRRLHKSVFDMRSLWKGLEKKSFLEIIKVEEGKHRLRKLCLIKNYIPSSNKKLILPCKNSKLDQTMNASMLLNEDNPEVSLIQKEFAEYFPLFDERTASVRNLTRAKTMMGAIQRHRIISDTQIFKQDVYAVEGNKLFSSKALRRMLSRLCSGGKMKKYQKEVFIESRRKNFTFYYDTTVDEDGSEFQNFLQHEIQKERTNMIANEVKWTQNETSSREVSFTSAAHNKPKFLRARTIHEYLWYIVYGSVEEGSEEEDESHIPAWKKYISPLPQLYGYPKGWCNISDAVDNMPFSLFTESVISSSTESIKGMEMYSQDPVKIHSRLHDIPVKLIGQLCGGRRYLCKFQVICETLSELGLLSFGQIDHLKKEEKILYIHKNASLKNIPPGILDIQLFSEGTDDGKVMFQFQSLKNIYNYWLFFQTISLDIPSEATTGLSVKGKQLSLRFHEEFRAKRIDEVVDDGRIPGDGLGPGGTDSSLYAHLRRNWSHNSDRHIEAASFAFSGYTKKSQMKKRLPPISEDESFPIQKSPVKVKCEKENKRGPSVGVKQLKRRSKFLMKTRRIRKFYGNDVSSHFADGHVDEASLRAEDQEQEVLPEAVSPVTEGGTEKMKEILKKKRCYDQKDEEAVKLLPTLRVSWSIEEDGLILFCLLTNLFLCNNSKWIVHATLIRDILHERFESSKTKTATACLRRKNYMFKKKATMKNIEKHLAEALQDRELCNQFKNGKKYSFSKMKENEEPFRSCLSEMEKKFSKQEDEFEGALQLLDTVKEIQEKYTIHEPFADARSQLKEAKTTSQIDFFTLQNFVHSLALLDDKIGRAYELFQLLSMYPQSTMSPVFEYMIAAGIFTKLKRPSDGKSSERCPIISVGSYQLAQKYHYLWVVTIPKDSFKAVHELHSAFPPRSEDPCHGSEYVSVCDSIASAILTTSLMATEMLHVETVTPEEIVIIQSIPGAPTYKGALPKNKFNKNKKDKADDLDDINDDDDDDDFLENVDIRSGANSRTRLSWYRCQYMHSKSTKRLDANNNLFINACSIKIKLSPDYQKTGIPSNYTAWMSSVHAIDRIKEWNRSNSCIHPKTCQVILKLLRSSIPESIEEEDLLERCCSLVGEKARDFALSIHGDIKSSTYVGRTVADLMGTCKIESLSLLMNILRIMTALNLVVRVGVNDFRYICMIHASNWFVQVKKNLKGRGVLYSDRCQFNFDDISYMERTLKPTDCPHRNKSSSGKKSVINEATVNEDGTVRTIIVIDNCVLKEQIQKKTLEKQTVECEMKSAQDVSTFHISCPPSPAPTAQSESSAVIREPPTAIHNSTITKILTTESSVSLQSTATTQSFTTRSATTTQSLTTESARSTHSFTTVPAATVEPIAKKQPDESACSKLPNANKRPATPSMRPNKRKKMCSNIDSPVIPVSSTEVIIDDEEIGNEAIESQADDSQIDSLIDELLNNEPREKDISNSDVCQYAVAQNNRSKKRKLEFPEPTSKIQKIQKLDDALHMDIIQDDSFDFSSAPGMPIIIPTINGKVDITTEVHPHSEFESTTSSKGSPVAQSSRLLRSRQKTKQTPLENSFTSTVTSSPTIAITTASNSSTISHSSVVTSRPPVIAPSFEITPTELYSHTEDPVKSSPLASMKSSAVSNVTSPIPLPSTPSSKASPAAQSSMLLRSRTKTRQTSSENSFISSPTSSLSPTATFIFSTTVATISSSTAQTSSSTAQTSSSTSLNSSTVTPKSCRIAMKPSTITPNLSTITPISSTIIHNLSTITPKPSSTITPKSSTITPNKATFTPSSSITINISTPTPKPPSTIAPTTSVNTSKFSAITTRSAHAIISHSSATSGLPPTEKNQKVSESSSISQVQTTTTSTQPTKIKVPINADLNVSNASAFAEKIKHILQTSGNLSPHSRIKIHLPPSLSLSSGGKLESSSKMKDPVQGDVAGDSSLVLNKKIPQMDGAVEEEDNSAKASCSKDTSSTERRTSNRLKNHSEEKQSSAPVGPQPKGTYKLVRILPRPWKTPEGTVNRTAFSSMLESICLYLVEHPGITKQMFLAKYHPVVQPVVLLEFIEILENIGVLHKKILKSPQKASLFSRRAPISTVTESIGAGEIETYVMSPDCIIKMAQFLNQLNANKRTADEELSES